MVEIKAEVGYSVTEAMPEVEDDAVAVAKVDIAELDGMLTPVHITASEEPDTVIVLARA